MSGTESYNSCLVIKGTSPFDSLSPTADSKVNVIHVSHVITAYIGIIISPHIGWTKHNIYV